MLVVLDLEKFTSQYLRKRLLAVEDWKCTISTRGKRRDEIYRNIQPEGLSKERRQGHIKDTWNIMYNIQSHITRGLEFKSHISRSLLRSSATLGQGL